MQSAHEVPQRRRSAFVAAFLSLLFPGLGHVYLGAHRRALGLRRAARSSLGALVAGIAVRLDVFQLAGIAIQDWFIAAIFIVNLIALAYRAVAIVDAWRIARWLGRSTDRPASAGAGRGAAVPARPRSPASRRCSS